MKAAPSNFQLDRPIVLIGLLALLLFASFGANCRQAWADGPHFDSGSPAGKEYALPLPQAREEALGGDAGGKANGAAPLFGVGIAGDSERKDQGTGSREGHRSASSGKATGTTPGGGVDEAAPRGAVIRIEESAGYSLANGVGVVAILLLLGLLFGVGLRLMARSNFGRRGPG